MRVLALRRPRAGDDGFSLIETVIAMTIAGAIFASLAFALIGGVHASVLSQQNQQAGDVLNKVVEQTRALKYDQLTMRTADLDVGETGRAPALSSGWYNPTADTAAASAVSPAYEDLVDDSLGYITQHVKTVVQNNGSYNVRQYLTQPVDAAGASYKRLTVVVRWSSLGKARTRTYSTLITPTKRGLPLPDFKLTAQSGLSQCRNPGSTAVYAFNIKNNGARDAWSIAAAPAGGWAFYADTDGNGAFDSTLDAGLATGPAGPSTGLIEPTAAFTFFAVASIPTAAATPPPYTWNTTFTATSEGQGVFSQQMTTNTVVQATPCGAVPSPTPTTTSSPTPGPSPSPTPAAPAAPTQPSAPCSSLTGPVAATASSGTLVRYYFYNPAQPGNTNATTGMPLLRDGGSLPPSGPLYAYSNDIAPGVAGRLLNQGTTSSTSPSQLASWTYQLAAASTLKGTGSVTFYAAPANGSATAAPSMTILLEAVNSSGVVTSTLATTGGTASAGWGCAGFRPFSLTFGNWGGGGTALPANQILRVRVLVTNNVPMVLGYGTSTFASEVTLPYSSGLG